MKRAKHLTRFRRITLKKGDYRLSLVNLTKGVQSCEGRPDTSLTRLSLSSVTLFRRGGLCPRLICLSGDFGDAGLNLLTSPLDNKPQNHRLNKLRRIKTYF